MTIQNTHCVSSKESLETDLEHCGALLTALTMNPALDTVDTGTLLLVLDVVTEKIDRVHQGLVNLN